ncbi:bifunctional protein FolD protein [Moorella thermoacetica]|uniref:Bifunctional protein FolD n=1 Tax=Neomoorella thermoacetica TaxID=1525 RepID=A0A1J5NXY8_NEOTH|nr:bifunctional protein FolD protein [Moorella thermoacetica]
MPAVKIDGKAMAEEIRQELAREVDEIKKKGITPAMALILAGDAQDSALYVRNKAKAGEGVGAYAEIHHLSGETTLEELLGLIEKLNLDDKIHGILVQLPLPPHLHEHEKKVMSAILPEKDIDAFHPVNIGNLLIGDRCFRGVTAHACVKILEKLGVELKDKHAVVVGWSIEIGKPVTQMLFEKGCAVTMVHPEAGFTPFTKQADIVIAEVGRPRAITGEMLKPGAIVIDTGANWVDGKSVGDVDYESAAGVAGYITPVPGGVGPMRIIMLIANLVQAAKQKAGLS